PLPNFLLLFYHSISVEVLHIYYGIQHNQGKSYSLLQDIPLILSLTELQKIEM
ncbi:hypothetical protein SUGI_0226650, partial [Cryptomeria japonica]